MPTCESNNRIQLPLRKDRQSPFVEWIVSRQQRQNSWRKIGSRWDEATWRLWRQEGSNQGQPDVFEDTQRCFASHPRDFFSSDWLAGGPKSLTYVWKARTSWQSVRTEKASQSPVVLDLNLPWMAKTTLDLSHGVWNTPRPSDNNITLQELQLLNANNIIVIWTGIRRENRCGHYKGKSRCSYSKTPHRG